MVRALCAEKDVVDIRGAADATVEQFPSGCASQVGRALAFGGNPAFGDASLLLDLFYAPLRELPRQLLIGQAVLREVVFDCCNGCFHEHVSAAGRLLCGLGAYQLGGNSKHCASSMHVSGHDGASPNHCTVTDADAGQDKGVATSKDCLAEARIPSYVSVNTEGAPVTSPYVVAYSGAEIESDESP